MQNVFDELGLPAPNRLDNIFASLERQGLLSRLRSGRGAVWTLSPQGRADSSAAISDLDLVALAAESARLGGSRLGDTVHPVIPPLFAPPELIAPLSDFLQDSPFDLNVFGMTRFPDEQEKEDDPVSPALEVAASVCEGHGFRFGLADDQAFSDDLWTNVAGHMWASRYGIAFFEDRRGRGINYNLTIEVGSMLITGRRCALLKDRSVKSLPTNLTGRIYKSVDLDDAKSVEDELHRWFRDDLRVGSCAACP